MKKILGKGHSAKNVKRWLALLLSVCLIGTMIPVTVRAEELTVTAEPGVAVVSNTGITYRTCDANGQNWITATCDNATKVTANDKEWGTSSTNTWYVASGNVSIGSRVTVNGNVHLILTDGCSLTVYGGIGVNEGSSLTIYGQTEGTGKLDAKGGGENAGIGGDSRKAGGTIIINGGTVTAAGGNNRGAGIGGGFYGNGGTITINGGTVTATADSGNSGGGAGIGGGRYRDGGSITINGGTVTASAAGSYNGGAGIGGGSGGPDRCGNGGIITITGGIVTAAGGSDGGAGIGGGGYSDKSGGNGGTIIISGGTVTATGGTNGGAGIGDGNNGSGGTVAISNGFVMASSISDKSNQESWCGVIFDGDNGNAYGASPTIDTECTIPGGKTLVVPENTKLTVNAAITNNGTIKVDGTMDAESADRIGPNVPRYKLTVANGTVLEGTAEPTDESALKYYYIAYKTGVAVSADTAPDGQGLVRWQVSGIDSTTQRTSPLEFTMPAAVVTVEAKYASKASTPNIEGKVTVAADKITIAALTDTTTYGDAEYSIDQNNWQTSNEFSGLNADTEYTVYARYLGNDSYAESDAGSTTVKTKKWREDTGITEPTGLTATYGQKLNAIEFEAGSGWSWKEPDTTVTMDVTTYEAQFKPTDTEAYDYSKVSGYRLDNGNVYIDRRLSVTVSKAAPTITWSTVTQNAAYTGVPIDSGKLTAPAVTLVNNETYNGSIAYSYRVKGSSDGFTSGLPADRGTYDVKANIDANETYEAAETTDTMTLTIDWLETEDKASLKDQAGASLDGNDWWAQSVTFTAPESYSISNSLTGNYGSSFDYDTETGAEGATVTYYLKNNDGEIAEKSETVHIDKTVPEWPNEGNYGICIKKNWWKSLLSNISFGLFYKEKVDVTVCANDSLSGVAAYYYYIDSTGGVSKTAEELDALHFTKYTGSVSEQPAAVTRLDADGNYIVYVYAVDAAGNRSDYICSDGVVVDQTAPAISSIAAPNAEAATLSASGAQISFTGSEAGTYFYECVEKNSSENVPDSITDFAVSGTDSKGMTTWTAKENVPSESMTADAANKISLSGLKANTEYTLYLAAVDLAGNSSTVCSQTFTTCRIIPTITVAPVIHGIYGQTVSAMSLTDGKATAGDAEITGTWELTDVNGSDVPAVGTTNSYEVTFKPEESQYAPVTVRVTPSIAAKPIIVTAEDKTKKYGEKNPEFTFTVPDEALVGSDTKEALGVVLSCEATQSSTVKEGGYAITGTADSTNYAVTVAPGILTITKAAAQINVGTASYEKTFGDAEFSLTASGSHTETNVQYAVTSGNDVVSVSNNTVTILKAGTATITVSLPESTNYQAAAETIKVNVAKKGGYSVDTIHKSYFYVKDSADEIDLSTKLPADCGDVTYGTPQINGTLYTENGQPTVSDDGKLSYTVKTAETYGAVGTITVKVTTENYADFTITVNITLKDQLPVKLQEGSSVTLKNSTLTYGEALSKLEFNDAVFVDDGGNVVTGNLAWKTDAVPDVGTTSAEWLFTPNNIEYATVENTVAITVNKATPQVTALPIVADRIYDPTVSLANSDLTGGTVAGVSGSSIIGVWSWQSANLIPSVNNTGYVAVFTPTDIQNYNTVTGNISVKVSKADPHIAVAPMASAITYGDTLSASELSVGTVQHSSSNSTSVSGNFAWADSSVRPCVSDSNITTYQVVFTPSDMDNYNTIETAVNVTVNRADNPPNMPSATMKVANSCKKVSDVTLPTDWVWQDTDKNTELIAGQAISANAVYDGADKGNYVKEIVSVSITREVYYYVADNKPNNGEVTTDKDSEGNITSTTSPTEVKVESGIANATVKTENLTEAIRQAEENKSVEIVFAVSKEEAGQADTIKLTISKTDVQQILEKTEADLVVDTQAGNVILSQDTLTEVVSAAEGKTLTIEVEKVTAPSAIQKTLAGKNAYIVDVTITSDSKSITTFGGKMLKVKLEIPSGLKNKNVAVIHISDGGKVEKMSGKKVTEGTTMYYEFTTTHLSAFALVDRSTVAVFNPPKKGTQLTDSSTKMVYKVTKSGASGGTVQFVKTKNTKAKIVAIPDSVTIDGITYKVTSIATNALKAHKTVTTVTIGKNVTTIGVGAFSGCSKLKKVTMGKSVATIGAKAFYKCTALTNITIPSSVTTIGDYAFMGCKKLTSMQMNTTKLTTKTVSDKAFSGISASTVIKVPKSKLAFYKKLFVKKDLSKKVKIKK